MVSLGSSARASICPHMVIHVTGRRLRYPCSPRSPMGSRTAYITRPSRLTQVQRQIHNLNRILIQSNRTPLAIRRSPVLILFFQVPRIRLRLKTILWLSRTRILPLGHIFHRVLMTTPREPRLLLRRAQVLSLWSPALLPAIVLRASRPVILLLAIRLHSLRSRHKRRAQ